MDIREFGRLLSCKWRQIAAMAALTMIIATAYVLFARPVFRAEGTLYLGDTGSGPNVGSDNSSLAFMSTYLSNSDVQTQIELIQARALIEKVVLETGVNASVTAPGRGNLLYWRWRFFHHRAVEAFAPQPGDLTAQFAIDSVPGSTGAFTLIVDDQSRYRVLMARGRNHRFDTILTGTFGQPASGGGLSLLVKPAVDGAPPEVGRRFTLNVSDAGAVTEMLLAKDFTVAAGGTVTMPTKVATVALRWGNPYQAQAFVDGVMRDFIATQLAWKTESASNMEDFVSNQLSNVRSSLFTADRNLADYQSATEIIDVSTNEKDAITALSQYEAQRATIGLRRESLRQLAKDIGGRENGLNPYLVSQTNDPVLDQLAEQLAAEETKLNNLGALFTGNADDVKAQEATVESLKNAIKSVVNNDLMLANGNAENLDKLIAAYQEKIKAMPAESLKIVSLGRASDVLGKLYVQLMEQEQEAEVTKAAAIINTRVVTPAQMPLGAAAPRPVITILAGLCIGLFGGLTLVLARLSFSGKFGGEEEIRRMIALPIYGVIPARMRRLADNSIIDSSIKGPFVEAFRMLRSNLYHSGAYPSACVLAVTSATSGDGKTTVARNLAKTLANDGKSVVLINGDLHVMLPSRDTQIQRPGLSEWLLGTATPELLKPPHQRFEVLTTGVLPPNPSELLNAAGLDEILTTLKSRFEFIIIDCPPLPIVADSMAIGRRADLILSVIRIDHTPKVTFKIHCEALDALGHRRGVVINGSPVAGYGYISRYAVGGAYSYDVEPVPTGRWRGVLSWLRAPNRLIHHVIARARKQPVTEDFTNADY